MKNTFSSHPTPASNPTRTRQWVWNRLGKSLLIVMAKQPLSNNRLSLAVAPIAAILTAENQKAGGKQQGSRRQS